MVLIISLVSACATKPRSCRSSRSSSLTKCMRAGLSRLSRRILRISSMIHRRTSSGHRVRGRACVAGVRTYRRVTSVAPSLENAMQYASLRPQPDDALVHTDSKRDRIKAHLQCTSWVGRTFLRKRRHGPIASGARCRPRARHGPRCSRSTGLLCPLLDKTCRNNWRILQLCLSWSAPESIHLSISGTAHMLRSVDCYIDRAQPW